MKSKMTAMGLWIMALITLIGVDGAYALKAPHNADRSVSCADCHLSGWQTRFKSRKPPCLDCHNPLYNGVDTAKKRYLTYESASNVFGTFTNVNNKKQTSHVWSVPEINSNAGVTKTRTVKRNIRYTSGINCTNCHYAHGSSDQNIFPQPFLRQDKRGDGICLTCHAARHVGAGSARTYPPAAGKYYSHPVEVNYSSIRAAKPDLFEATPLNPYPSNPSANLRLYTAFNFDSNSNAASVKAQKAVICSTCHGPLHAADSNPYTFDSLTAYSQGNYSTGDGYLLRRYNLNRSNDICTSCHKVTAHKNYKCNRCHTPHKKAGENNMYLILENISTPYNGKRPVQFISTSEMAARFAAGYSSTQSRFQRSVSNRICQVCHMNTKWHKNYSAIGTTGKNREAHATPNEYLGGGKYRNCTQCHEHGSGFAVGGAACASCHGNPTEGTPYPAETYGKHEKHVGKNTGASYGWSGGTLSDDRQAGEYGFSCGRCHNPWTPYTASSVNALRHAGTAPGSLKNYTADFGFKNGTPLPQNPATASYSPGGRGSGDTGASGTDNYKFSTPSAGSCINLYCHGQFFGGYTGNNPVFNGANARQSCNGGTGRVCHGTNATNIPGSPSESGTPVGVHRRHVGSASEQYGSGTPNFRCNACHNATVGYNIQTSVTDKRFHVNGRVNVRFAGAYGDGSSRYDTFNDYSVSPNAAGSPKAYKTCGLIYCHSDGSRTQGNYSAPFNAGIGTGSGKYPNWSSTRNFTTTLNVGGKTFKRRCSRCHGNSTYVGITAAMPGVTSKGNSHTKHVINNGFLCNVCHSTTVNADNKSIASTTLHVNKAYDISIISKYGGTYDSGTKRCSDVDCHGGRLTGAWGDAGRCQDCHFKSTSESQSDEGYNDSYTWRNMTTTSSIPRIYSSEWTKFGHGATASYPSSGNSGANKSCYYGGGGTGCHKASGSKSHKDELTGNVYRLYTGYNSGNTDFVCKECHSGGARSGEATKNNIKGHTSADMGGWGNATWQFTPKCIDCHDPHGDKNRYMIHKHDNYSGSDPSGKRTYDTAQTSGLINFSTVGGGQMNWSSYVKADYSGLCQRCHNLQTDMNNFNKAAKSGGGYSGHQSGNRCTNCHKHTEGFKGLNCNGCHYFPPTLSGKHAFHVATSVDNSHVSHDLKSTKTKYAYGCGKCHDVPGSHYTDYGTLKVYTADLAFDANDSLPRNTSAQAQYAFGAKSSFDDGVSGADNFKWVSTKGTCKNLYCHGQFFGGYSGNDPQWYNTGLDDPQTCGKCHGAVKNSSGAPTGGAHNKHVTTYSFPCRNCHRDTTGGFNAYTVADRTKHVNGITNIFLYTTESRIGGNARYGNAGSEFISVTTNTNPASAPNYRFCQNIYCHSRGTSTLSPYTSKVAYPNYTAKWGDNLAQKWGNAGKRCSYCHGNTTYEGITAAMPMQSGQAHKKHVVDNGFTKCYICHSNVVDSNSNIVSTANHVNRFKNISVIMTYRTGDEAYDPAGAKRCSNIKCHGGRTTPAWSASAACTDCHYQSSGAASAEDSFTWQNFSGASAKIYSTEWTKRGHGASGVGTYPFSANNKAGKNCTNCHTPAVKHNQSNYFRIITANNNPTADPNKLCLRCHGSTGSGLVAGAGFGSTTGIQNHTWENISTNGYKGGANGKAKANGGWNFTPKCVDCHDPHGDKNNYMTHSFINMSGSDSIGRPLPPYNQDTNLMNFTAVKGGTAVNWSSFVRGGAGAKYGICQRCHSVQTGMGFFTKTSFTPSHNAGKRCTECHKHKVGFTPAGCDACHGYPPPNGPSGWNEVLADSNTWGLHTPHARNPKGRPGIPAENDVTPSSERGYNCNRCHGNSSNGQGTGHSTYTTAVMQQLTSLYGKWSKGGTSGKTSVADDTCWSVKCHTPRSYTRKWAKPLDCDDCHGFQQKTATVYNTHTTQSHKIHVRYTSSAGYKKKYGFACSNCHYDWVTNNNYSTHYNSFVNITANGPVNTKGGAFYGTWGRSFKGYTTGNERTAANTQCSDTYCHGNFSGGVNGAPSWKKGVTTINCASCHRSAYVDATGMPGKHPKHAGTSKGGYQFACVRCHSWTTNNITTVLFNRTSHVNTRKDVNFNTQPVNQTAGTYPDGAASKRCENTYCHSRGTTDTSPFTGSAYSNFTAKWGDTLGGYKVAPGSRGRCNYCHGNKTWTGTTSAMPNYDNNTPKANRHDRHVRTYNFVCNVCHYKVTNNNTSIEVSGGRALHVNGSYNVNFRQSVGGKPYVNNTGLYTYISGTPGSKCKNTYCHSRGTDWTKPYNTRTSFANWTARWGDTLGSYKQATGLKAKCNYCHGNRAYTGTTSAMPNYSTETGKANSHRAHVIGNGFMCRICHYGVAQNNTSISDTVRHADRFYNISLAPTYRDTSQAGTKAYSTSWNPAVGGTCMRTTCHGTGKPKWGGTVTCRSCHMSNTGDVDDYGTVNSTPAKIYSTEYMNTGHGRPSAYPYSGNAGASKDCTNCHKSTVGHKNPANPYRLYTSDPDAFCGGCHGTAAERNTGWPSPDAAKVDYKTHSKANILDVYGADATWPPVFQNEKAKCVDCHDPHGDKNRYMVHALINYSGSGTYGQPQNYSPTGVMNFTSVGGAQFNWSSYVRSDYSRICQRCHNTQANMKNFNKAAGAAEQGYNAGHNPGKRCTTCHSHKNGFGPAESSGNQSCKDCHADLFNPMNSQAKSYHHVMQNTTATGANKYPMSNGIGDPDSKRRCLMCHVDHNVFRPDMNGNDPRGRAANLRANVFTWPTSDVASTRNNSDWSGTDSRGGICLSCHTIAQTKNQTKQFNDGSTKTLRLFTSMYRNTPHNYTAIGVIKKDGSQFKANCLKCHNDTMQKTRFVSATTTGFGLHDSKLRRLNAKLGLRIYDGTVASSINSTLVVSGTPWVADEWKTRVVTITSGTGVGQTRVVLSNTIDTLNLTKVWSTNPGAGATFTIGDPPEEDFCFNCHSQTSNPYGSDAAGNKDYYGMVTFVNKKALKMEQTFTGDNGSITTGGSATTFTDSSKSWTPGQWVGYSVKFLSGTSKNVGKERVISANTATSVTWVTALTANTAAGDTYSIGNPFRHRIDQFSGQHKSDEAIAAPGTTTAAGWFGDTGTGVHVGCADCHNPHAQRKPGSDRGTSTKDDAFTTQSTIKIAGKNWASNQWIGYVAVAVDRSQAGDERMIVSNTADRFKVGATFSPRMTGVYFTIIPRGRANIATDIQGNYLNGPNNGGWGVKAPLTSWPSPAPDTAGSSNNVQSPAFSKVTTLVAMKNKVYDLCLKCHSDYGWGTGGTPFRIMDGGISAMGVYTAGESRNIGKLINPNNLAHHALVAPGNNQPIRPNYGLTNISSYYNNNWPSWKGSATRRLRMTTGGHANVNQAMPSTVIPGWYLYVGSTVPNAKTNGTAGIGAITPYYKGWLQIKSMVNYTSFDVDTTGISIPALFTNRSGFSISAGLGNAFVPPYGPWSVINCADCHDTDGSGDPSGPHGSGRNWLLRKMEAQKFPWFNGTNVIPVGWDVDGWATTAKWAPNTLCLNCHRADVYGNEGHDPLATTTSGGTGTAPTTTSGKWFNWAWRGHYSRQPHSPDLGDVYLSKNGGTTTTFRVICMQCHAGNGTGSIHGTNLGASYNAAGTRITTASYRGKRFLTGGAWTGLIRGTTTVKATCNYEPNTGLIPATINNCSGSGDMAAGARTFATYDYDGGVDY